MDSFYEVEHFYKDEKRSVMDCHNAISRRNEGRGSSYFSNGRTIKETDSDWELGQQWE